MAFGSGIVYKQWLAGGEMPDGIVQDVIRAMGEECRDDTCKSDLMFFSCPIFEDAPEELLQKMRSHLLHCEGWRSGDAVFKQVAPTDSAASLSDIFAS